MDPLYIQYLLRKSGKTQRDIAKGLGGRAALLAATRRGAWGHERRDSVAERGWPLGHLVGHPACAKDASTPTGQPNTPRLGLQFPACLTRSALAGRPSTEGFRFILRRASSLDEEITPPIFAGSPRP